MKMKLVFEFDSVEKAQEFLDMIRSRSESRPQPEPQPEPQSESQPTPGPSFLDAAKVLTQLIKARGRPIAVALLRDLGVERLSDLPEETVSEFVSRARQLMEEE